jgi:NADH dehydrogenase
MAHSSTFARLRGAVRRWTDGLGWLPPLIARLAVGITFALTGWGKLHNLGKVTEFFTSLGIPLPGANAALIGCVEFFGGLALIFGVLTRLACIPLLVSMVVAVLTAKRDQLGFVSLFGFEELTYAVVFTWLLVAGPGAASIDHIVMAQARTRGALGRARTAIGRWTRRYRFIGPTLARLALGITFIATGGVAIQILGALLLVGLFTRAVTLPLLIALIAAIARGQAGEVGGFTDLIGLQAFTECVLLFWLAIAGPGRLSLDALLLRRTMPPRTAERPQRIAVIGGGFGGIEAARHLEKELGDDPNVEIILINKENYFVFQPMLAEVISGTLGMLDPVCPIRRMLPRTTLHVREVEGVDLARQVISTSPGFKPHTHEIPFDHLVLALGNVTDFRGQPGLPEHAIPFKNLADALFIRNHIIRALEEAAIESDDMELRRQLLTFVVAGGGYSGVEAVAEINDFVREVASNYRSIDPSEIRVVLVHAQDRVLPEVNESLGRYAQKILSKRGVELRLKNRLVAATGQEARLSDGSRIPTRTLVSTVPSSPHPLLAHVDVPQSKKGKVQVGRDLRVRGRDNIWSLGDCAEVPNADGTISPPTAQHATRQAKTLAHNIAASLRGEPLREFGFRGLGSMGSLGRHNAVADLLGVKVAGVLAWLLWRTVYLMKLPGWGRRLKVAASWTFDLVLPPELVQLRVGARSGIVREHFEAGQEVFQQGDLGDRIYIILNGRAEVLHEQNGSSQRVAELGAGECFGEMALLGHATRNATVRCVQPMDTLGLPKYEFDALAENLPDIRSSFERIRDQRVGEPQARPTDRLI